MARHKKRLEDFEGPEGESVGSHLMSLLAFIVLPLFGLVVAGGIGLMIGLLLAAVNLLIKRR